MMRVSASIELMMQLAAQEAIAAEFKEIEPEHCLGSILKLSELPVEEVDKLVPVADVAQQLAAEVSALREELVRRSIDSTTGRRRLREVLGRGKCPYEGGQIHRSAASRELFDQAVRLADDAGSDTLTTSHLLQAILAQPTPCMRQALGEAAFEVPAGVASTPALDEHGRDLVRLAVEGKLPPASDRAAPARALLRALAQADGQSVFLVTALDTLAMSVITDVAQAIGKKDCPASLKGKRLVDISAVRPEGRADPQALELLDQLLSEAAGAKEVMLVLPAWEDAASAGGADRWLETFGPVCRQRRVTCICRLAPAICEARMREDRGFKQIAQFLWIEQAVSREIPHEL